ncbi:transcriptional regulator PadR-like family protein [Asticcacaulis biprosthecium C19]|uniref:Transcriptional regulator PadR-like family protein n=1 Tax=Asticcacaulis biprosthecium C19 TaxID=715226 RepID=F4QGM0_9CAUL|nr:PadR family transcriptional regulator [Asticcacaulis biprosthecium]EGF93701.1 transcriptional regulator PadR-like family protein [Asticcacaulis biprosthecium C19]
MRDFPSGRGGFGRHGGHHESHGSHRFGGRGRREGRGFGPGGLRLVLLKFISEKPSHGYELIKSIEDEFQGAYAPSPGIVYPALSWLEDGGFIVIAADADNRKVATITEAGQALLSERAADLDRLFEAMADKPGSHDDYAPLYRAMDNLKAALRTRAVRPMAKSEIENVVDWIDDLAKKIERS